MLRLERDANAPKKWVKHDLSRTWRLTLFEAYLRQHAPNIDVLLDFQPEELGAHIIQAMRPNPQQSVSRGHVKAVFYPNQHPYASEGFPRQRNQEVERAIFEAWAWLEAQGFLIWQDMTNGANGYRVLSRRAEQISAEQFHDFAAALALPREIIHASIRDHVWSDFIRGHYDAAALHAARHVEIAVRNACGLGPEHYGRDLMIEAFHSDRGTLRDSAAVPSERKARMNLFLGYIGCYKNPLSHRDINISDPHEAIEIILMASHLLRIVEARTAIRAQNER